MERLAQAIETSHLGTPSNCLFFHHGQPVQEGRGSGGVGILLGSGGKTAWKQAGSPESIRGELIKGVA
eukprot:13908643-Ditylum_brightwellii.AAC.1